MKIKFLASSEELCPADSLGFVCSSLVSEELPTFQRERACFGCCGLALCQPSFQHTGAAAGFCVPALLCFQMPMKFPPPILHGGGLHTTKIQQNGRNPASPGHRARNSPAAIRCLQNVAETLQGEKKKTIKIISLIAA